MKHSFKKLVSLISFASTLILLISVPDVSQGVEYEKFVEK